MQSIGSVGGTAGQSMSAQVHGGQQASQSGEAAKLGSSATTSSQTMSSQTTSIHSSMTHVTQVSSRVDSLLSDLGIDLQSNQLLRMIIGLMILELLLGKDGEAAPGNGGEFDMLSRLDGNSQSSRTLMIQSSTSTYSADYYSSELTGARAVQSSAGTHPDGQSGNQIDLSA